MSDQFRSAKVFVLLSLKPKAAKIAVSTPAGTKTITLKLGNLTNKDTGARFALKLVYTGDVGEDPGLHDRNEEENDRLRREDGFGLIEPITALVILNVAIRDVRDVQRGRALDRPCQPHDHGVDRRSSRSRWSCTAR